MHVWNVYERSINIHKMYIYGLLGDVFLQL